MTPDHEWLATYPRRPVQGRPNRLSKEPANYFQDSMLGQGLYVDLPGYGFHIFDVRRI
jgi:hypothetical protein